MTASLLHQETPFETHYFAVDYLPLVHKVVGGFAKKLPSHVELDELLHVGVIGLLDAIEKFDAQHGRSFISYASMRIRGSILDELRKNDPMGREKRCQLKLFQEVCGQLTSALGRDPEEHEWAEALNLSVDDFREKMQQLIPVSMLSIEDCHVAANTELSDPEISLQRREMLVLLEKSIRCLPEKHQQVLNLYYKEELILKDIATILSCSESRVCQILSIAILHLKSHLQVLMQKGSNNG